MKYKILSVGTTYLDINCFDFPFGKGLKPNREVVGEKYEIAPGGSALNFARFCASLGLNPVFIGKTGEDEAATILAKIVVESGVTPAFINSPDVSTNIGINYVGKNNSSMMTIVGSANRLLGGKEVERKFDEYIGKIEYLYLGGCLKLKALLSSFEKMARRAKKKGVKVALDHGRVTNVASQEDLRLIRRIVSLVDFYFPSKDEALSVWGSSSIQESIKKIRKISEALVVVKDAEKGSIGFSGETSIKVPIFRVKVLNTIGAGDIFNAGFIKAWDSGMDMEKSMRYASATAAIKISQKKLPTDKEIEAFLKRHS